MREVLDNGLKLPFAGGAAPQQPHRGRRTFIEEQDVAWVRATIAELVRTGAALPWRETGDGKSAQAKLRAMGLEALDEPFFVMPVGALEKSASTPEERKLRLIHDCRAINEYLDLSSLGFKLEQLVDFAKCLKRGDRLISTDLASAYHHVGVAPAHWKYLGLEFEGVHYVFCVLPFGLSASAGTFCRFSAVAAKMVRASGITSASIIYIDDLGGALAPDKTADDAAGVITIVKSLGFSVSDLKTNLDMNTSIVLLGFTIDTVAWTFGVPERRLRKLKATARAALGEIDAEGGQATARLLARLAGQVMSMQIALGLVCRVRSRYILTCVRPAAAARRYGMLVPVSARARGEIELWAGELEQLPLMPLTVHTLAVDFRLEADASATAAAALFFDLGAGPDEEPERIVRSLTARERGKSSTLRELLGYAHGGSVVAAAHGGRLRGRRLEIVGDSQAAGAIFRRGGSQRIDDESGELELYEAFLSVFEAAERGGFSVVFRWVPREQLVAADALSKYVERNDFSLTPAALALVRQLGPWDIDRFAAAHNAKASTAGAVPRFNSLFATEGAEAVDAFAQSWVDGVSFVLPPFQKVDQVLDHIERDDAEAVVVVPLWRKQPFWRRLSSGAWRRRMSHDLGASLVLPPGSPTAARLCPANAPFGYALLRWRSCRR